MATKYPTAFDDPVTLGPTFVDVSPPTDPQRNIAAEFRNNLNDGILAVQARLGIINSAVNTSVDWGLMSISGTPNQGVRFAGGHAAFPGLVAEDGIFIDSGTGNVSYHKAGDATGVFTDLTGGGGVGTWDALYAADKTLNIDTSALIWTQTSTAGYGFQLLRNESTADSAIVEIHNQNASDNQPCLDLNVASTSSYFMKANYDSGGAGDEFFVDYVGNVGLKGALQRIVSGNLTVSTTDGKIILDADQNSNDGIEFYAHSSGGVFLFNAAGTNTGTLDVNVASWNLSGTGACAIGSSSGSVTYTASGGHNFTGSNTDIFTSRSFTVNATRAISLSNTDSGYDITVSAAHANNDLFLQARASGLIPFNTVADTTLTTTKQSVVGAINEVNAGVAAIDWDSLYADSQLLTVSGVPLDMTTSQQTPPLQLYNSHFASPNGDLLKMYDGTGPGVLRFLFHRKGNFELTPEDNFQALNIDCTVTNVAGDISGATIDMAQSVGLTTDGKDVWGFTSVVYAHTDDVSTTIAHHAGFRATMSGTRPAFNPGVAECLYSGFYADDTLDFSVYVKSPGIFEVDASAGLGTPALDVYNTAASGTSTSFAITDGELLDPSPPQRFRVRRGGETKITAAVDVAFDSAFGVENTWDTEDATGMCVDIFSKKTTGSVFTPILRVFNNGQVLHWSHNDAIGVPLMRLVQDDADQAFINFSGTSSGAVTTNITTFKGGAGAVQGPTGQTASEAHFQFSEMLMVEIGGSERWIPLYTYNA